MTTHWTAHPPAPWRRYAARFLDYLIISIVIGIGIPIVCHFISPAIAARYFAMLEDAEDWQLIIPSSIMVSMISGSLIGVIGMTPGKLVFGVKVVRLDGDKLGFRAGLGRDISVLVKGLGLGIPIVSLITLWISYHRLKEHGVTRWDEDKFLILHRPTGHDQYALNTIGIALLVTLLVSLVVAA